MCKRRAHARTQPLFTAGGWTPDSRHGGGKGSTLKGTHRSIPHALTLFVSVYARNFLQHVHLIMILQTYFISFALLQYTVFNLECSIFVWLCLNFNELRMVTLIVCSAWIVLLKYHWEYTPLLYNRDVIAGDVKNRLKLEPGIRFQSEPLRMGSKNEFLNRVFGS